MQELLKSAMDIGEQMLLSGAEVHRVEDSIKRICHAGGATRTDVFIITSSMVLTVHDGDGRAYTETRRINSLGTDYEALDKLNSLSRKICSENLASDEINAELDRIKDRKRYPLWIEFIAYAFVGAAFTLFFGGTLPQAVVALFIGAALRGTVYAAEKIARNTVFLKFISSFALATLAHLSVRLGIVPSPDEIIIGNIMLLIPGIGFTNALRDLFMGDSIAGSLRLLEAVLSAAAIAAGYFLLVFLTGGAAI